MSEPVEPAPVPAPPIGYAPPTGYAPPAGYAPPSAYTSAAPPYAAPYVAPVGYGPQPSYSPAPPTSSGGSSALGLVALFAALAAAVGASIGGAIAAFNIGLGVGQEIAMRSIDAGFDWSILTPVREWVLLGELSFWAGTILGVWALIQGIVAIVKRRGRGQGIAAVAIAALGPIAFGIAVQASLTAGFAAGSSIGG
ncbi:MAG: hypothetical protein ABWY55_01795 [Microbacterium sp.]